MVKIPGFRAFTFHSGLDRIRDSFRASIRAMETAQADAASAYAAYDASGDDDAEYDEDGVLLSSTRHTLQWDELNASLATTVVREAFVTSIFHYWERSARAWATTNEGGFSALRKSVADLGYPLHPDLTALNSLNNLLKHDNPDRGLEVYDYRSSLFIWSREPAGSWQSALRLRNEDVEHFIEVVRASGPQFEQQSALG